MLLGMEVEVQLEGRAYVFRSRLFLVFVVIVHHHVVVGVDCFSLAFDFVGHLMVAGDG